MSKIINVPLKISEELGDPDLFGKFNLIKIIINLFDNTTIPVGIKLKH